MTCTITTAISRYIAAALARELPSEVVEKTKHHLLDSLAAMVSGVRLAPGLAAARVAEALGGRPEATVAGTDLVTSAVHAALANGMAAHADETDDSHLGGLFHPGCGIVPAALAVAEREASDGVALLRAIALGYDIGARFTKALGYRNPRSAPHSTHTIGTGLGAAAAAGALLRLSQPQAVYLLSYAVQQASGIPYWPKDSEHIEKSFDFGGMGARNGVTAALMVAAGCSGVADCLTGSPSYLAAFALEPRPEELDAELGSRYEILAASIKKWCVGSPIQAALDSLTALIAEHELRAEQVESLTATLPDDRLPIVDNREMPDICLQHLLAVLLIDGGLGFAGAHDLARMKDPEVLALRKRIRAVPSPELTRAKPARQAIVEVETRDGRRLRHRTRAVLGTPDSPMSRAQVEAKAVDLLSPVIGASRARDLAEAVWSIETLGPVTRLRPLLQA